jgi:hypothetical protein
MSEALFLVNPRRKKRRKSRKGRMPAGLRRYWAAKRRGAKVTKRRRRRRHSAVVAAPRRRRRRAVMRNPRRRRSHARITRRRYSRRRHSNPFNIRGLTHTLMPAAVGATGAVALDVLYAYASPYLPASMQTGFMPVIAKLAGAIGLGFGARKIVGRERGNAAMLGALTVVAYGAIKPLIASFAPTIKGLSGYADYTSYGVGVGAYVPNQMQGLGFYSPASVMQTTPENSLGAYIGRPGMAGFNDWSGWQNDHM